jgi:cell division protein FtsB
MPQWFVFVAIASITLMLCMAINLRAYSEMSVEMEQNERLSVQLESLTNENLAIQEEVHNLKIDSSFVEQEARKIGLSRSN